MKQNDKTNPIVIEHWKNKFEKSIQILLKSGLSPEDLIEQIKRRTIYSEDKNN